LALSDLVCVSHSFIESRLGAFLVLRRLCPGWYLNTRCSLEWCCPLRGTGTCRTCVSSGACWREGKADLTSLMFCISDQHTELPSYPLCNLYIGRAYPPLQSPVPVLFFREIPHRRHSFPDLSTVHRGFQNTK